MDCTCLDAARITEAQCDVHGCSLCSAAAILADTEDWTYPLCADCFEDSDVALPPETLGQLGMLRSRAEAKKRGR